VQQRLRDRGGYSSATEIAEAEKISKSYVGRILRLALLAPDLVEAILGGWADRRESPASRAPVHALEKQTAHGRASD
jgi:hypothetical protein